MTTLYLIRHGETVWNADGRFQGQQNTPLNALGRAQADSAARALADIPFEAVYTSDLARAAETAEIIAAPHALAPLPDPRLREVHFGEWEGLAMPEVTTRWPEIVAAWRADSLRTRPPGGETLEQLQQRVVAALTDIVRAYPTGTLAVVGHGGSLRAIITHILNADLSIFRRLRLDNCSISIITVTDGQYTLRLFNDICHLGARAPHATLDETGDQWRQALAPAPHPTQ